MKSAFKKRKMYEALLENVPMLQTLEVNIVNVKVAPGSAPNTK